MAEGQEGGFNMLREVQDLAEKFKEDDEQYISPYAQLEKAAVLQEARYVASGIECSRMNISGRSDQNAFWLHDVTVDIGGFE